MSNARFLLRTLVIASALAVAVVASSSSAPNGQPGPVSNPVINTVLQADLTLHSTLSVPLLPQEMNNPGKNPSGGFCLGSCTALRCTTNADCGPGGLCKPFVICGAMTGKIERNEGIGLSSHRGEMPTLNVKCK